MRRDRTCPLPRHVYLVRAERKHAQLAAAAAAGVGSGAREGGLHEAVGVVGEARPLGRLQELHRLRHPPPVDALAGRVAGGERRRQPPAGLEIQSLRPAALWVRLRCG